MFRHLFGRSEFPAKANAQRLRRRAKHGRRLHVESLENRVLLASDLFANATNLGSSSVAQGTGSNVGFTGEPGEPAQSGDITSAWWRWTAPVNGEVTVDTFGSDFDTFLTIATGNAVNALTVLAQNDDSGGTLQSAVTVDVTAGQVYRIAVDGFLPNTGNIDLNLSMGGGGGGANNDLFANRTNLGSGTLITSAGSNIGYTSESGEPAQNGEINSAWWQWTAPSSGPVTIDTSGSGFDTYLTVATGTSVNNLTVLAQNDDFGGRLQSEVTVNVSAGNVLQIAVDGFQSQTGNIVLNVDFGGVGGGGGQGNDNFADRDDLGSETLVNTSGTNVGYTSEVGEPRQSGDDINSAWWQWTAPIDGTLTVDTFGSGFDTILTLTTGDTVSALTVQAQNDDAPGSVQSEVVFDVVGGTRYQIAVDGFQALTGSITLNLSFVPRIGGGGGNNDNFANRFGLGADPVVTTTGTNFGFTGEAGEPAQSGDITSAWWEWFAPANGIATINTFGSGFDTFLTVATGTAVNNLTVVAQNDDAGSLQSEVVIPVTAGTGYKIAVDGFLGGPGNQGNINLNVRFEEGTIPTDNDVFADRVKLGSVALVNTVGTNLGFTAETGEPQQSGVINSAWWQWTAPTSGRVTIDTFGSNFTTFITVATGNAVNALTVLKQSSLGAVEVDVIGGTIYQIAVDGFGTSMGNISLNIGYGTGPGAGPNDLFANRNNLGSNASINTTGTNVGFTGEPGEPLQSGVLNSAWWQWTPSSNGTVTIDTVGSNFDTFLTVATGSSVGGLTVLAQNDDAQGLQSRIQIAVFQGVVYHIAVDGFQVATGNISLNLEFQGTGGGGGGGGGGVNDLFADRINLASATSVATTGTNVDFAGEAGEPVQSGDISSAWWRWTAPANGSVTIDTFGSNFDTYLTVATGSSVNSLNVLAQNDDALFTAQSRVVLNVIANTTYNIAVDGFRSSEGEIDLNILFTP